MQRIQIEFFFFPGRLPRRRSLSLGTYFILFVGPPETRVPRPFQETGANRSRKLGWSFAHGTDTIHKLLLIPGVFHLPRILLRTWRTSSVPSRMFVPVLVHGAIGLTPVPIVPVPVPHYLSAPQQGARPGKLAAAVLVALEGDTSMQTAKAGDLVQVHYVKRFQDGSAASSRERGPVELTVGIAHPRLPGLGLALVGLAPGTSTKVSVPPEQAYGLTDPARVRRWPRTRFPKERSLAIGKWVRIRDSQGRGRVVRILEVHGKMVVVDTNHRKAGQAMEMEVELIGIQSLPAGENPRRLKSAKRRNERGVILPGQARRLVFFKILQWILGRKSPAAPGARLPNPDRKEVLMAGRILNRRELRKQADQAEHARKRLPRIPRSAVVPPGKNGPEGPRNAPGEKTASEEGAAPPARSLGRFRRRHETGRDLRL